MVRKIRKKGLKDYYSESWNYICDSKRFIYFIVGFFVFFMLVGLLVPVSGEFEEKILQYISELLAMTEGLSQWGLVRFILWNNVQSSFFGVVLGIFLGVFPLISSLVNGYILGFVLLRAIEVEGPLTVLRLAPHGIFELPALFISLGLGLKLGWWLIADPFRFYWKRHKLVSFLFIFSYLITLVVALVIDDKFRKKMKKSFDSFRENFWNSIITFVLIILPLLIVAAIIEGTLIFFSG